MTRKIVTLTEQTGCIYFVFSCANLRPLASFRTLLAAQLFANLYEP